MGNFASGRFVKANLLSSDLQTAAPVVLYDANTSEAITFTPGMTFVMYALTVNNGDSAAIVTVFDDVDGDAAVDTGEHIFHKSMNAKEQAGFALVRGFPAIRLPKVKASAASANTAVHIYGELLP